VFIFCGYAAKNKHQSNIFLSASWEWHDFPQQTSRFGVAIFFLSFACVCQRKSKCLIMGRRQHYLSWSGRCVNPISLIFFIADKIMRSPANIMRFYE
jgi:hypothetical protein